MFSLRFLSIVPEKSVYIIERFGKYHTSLYSGLNFLIPILDRIAYKQTLKEEAIFIDKQTAITKDNVTIQIDGTLFIKVTDPYKASYKVEKPQEAVKLLCQTIIRSEIGKMKLDQLLQERKELNLALYNNLNKTAEDWGLSCLSVEILQIEPPEEIKKSMQQQAEAERLKRRDILYSEGKKISQINIAEGKKIGTIKKAEGEAQAMELTSQSEAMAIEQISNALNQASGNRVVDYILLSNYLAGYNNVLEKSNVVVVPNQSKGQQQNNDLLGLAGLMLFGKNGNISHLPIQFEKSSQQQMSTSKSHTSNPKQQEGAQELMENLIKKNVYYDDINLYSTDEEAKKQLLQKSNSQNVQHR